MQVANVIGYARLVKVGNRITTYYSEDKVTWTMSDKVDVIGDFDIYWPILIEEEENNGKKT
jgi:hypothetical protein